MKTPITDRNLTKQAPHSPRERFGGYAILARTVDKCRASESGKVGEYHYDCPLDNQLFSFKGINGSQFKSIVNSAKTYDDVVVALQSKGIPKTTGDIDAWSDKMEDLKLKDIPTLQDAQRRAEVMKSCQKLGLDFETTFLFEWLEADDQASFRKQPEFASR